MQSKVLRRKILLHKNLSVPLFNLLNTYNLRNKCILERKDGCYIWENKGGCPISVNYHYHISQLYDTFIKLYIFRSQAKAHDESVRYINWEGFTETAPNHHCYYFPFRIPTTVYGSWLIINKTSREYFILVYYFFFWLVGEFL